MGLLDYAAPAIEAEIQRRLKNPGPGPGSSFNTASFLAAGVKGVGRGVAELAASFMDASNAVGEDPSEQRRRDAAGLPPAATGDEIRARSADLVPDAITAHAADQVLYGFTRLGTKIAAASLAAGPVGTLGAAGLVGAEETNTATRELIGKGVDPATALKAGAVQGVGAAAALVPFAGPTIKATAALAIGAGPGAFMAQEAASRKILERAGYADEASKHDPLDPLGLTIATLLPAVFGGAHAVGLARAAKPAPSLASVVEGMESGGKRYGADGQLLTSPKGAQGEMQVMPGTATDPGFGVIPAKDNSPAELARVGRDYLDALQHRYQDPAQALAAYNAGPGKVDAALAHGADWLKHLPDETQAYVAKGLKKLGEEGAAHAAADPAAVDAARVRVTNDALHQSLPDEIDAHAELMRAADEVAAGRMPDVRPVETTALPEFREWFGDSKVVDAQGRPMVVYHGTTRNLERITSQADATGSVGNRGIYFTADPRYAQPFADGEGGNIVPVYVSIRNPKLTSDAVESGIVTAQQIDRLRAEGHDGIINTSNGEIVAFSSEQIKSAIGNSGKFDPHSGSLIDPLRPGEISPRERANTLPHPDSVTAADEAAKAKASRQAAIDAATALFDHEVEMKAASDAAEAQQASASITSRRADKIAEESPDMLVKLPGSDESVTVAQALEQAREAYKAEAGFKDWVKAAAECALSFGA